MCESSFFSISRMPGQVKNSFKDTSVLLSLTNTEKVRTQHCLDVLERQEMDWLKRERDASPYHSGEVDGHEWVRRQEEIIEPQNMPEIWQDVAVPCDEPAQGEDRAHLRPAAQRPSMISIINIISSKWTISHYIKYKWPNYLLHDIFHLGQTISAIYCRFYLFRYTLPFKSWGLLRCFMFLKL